MQIVFSNGETVSLILNQTPVAAIYQKIYKHLQHVTVPFQDWDSPFYFCNHSLPQLVNKLIMYAQKVDVPIDTQRCLAQDQDYFNTLHVIYENNSNNGPAWSDFHRHLHMCEKNHDTDTVMQKTMKIDYNNKSGLLEKPFDQQWLTYATSKISAGDAFVCWQELGKTPYMYWSDNEPNDIERMRQVIRPWAKLRPNIFIALEDIDLQKNPKELAEFESWRTQYSQQLCEYWNIPSWTLNDMNKCLVLGKVSDIHAVISLLKNNGKPIQVLL
jgi:hypothetical protein